MDLYTRLDGYRDRVVARVLSTPQSVERCAEFGFSGPNLICGQGPFSEEATYAALKDCGAKYMVTKDSGDWWILTVFGVFFISSALMRTARLHNELQAYKEIEDEEAAG